MGIKKIGTLEIESEAVRPNPTFFIIQKIGIILMAGILIASMVGVFGHGFLSTVILNKGDLKISYDKFARAQASTYYHITMNFPADDKKLTFWISPSFYNKLTIVNINPQPVIEKISDNKIVYQFDTNNTDKVNITIIAKPENYGFVNATIGKSDDESIAINQFIYP